MTIRVRASDCPEIMQRRAEWEAGKVSVDSVFGFVVYENKNSWDTDVMVKPHFKEHLKTCPQCREMIREDVEDFLLQFETANKAAN